MRLHPGLRPVPGPALEGLLREADLRLVDIGARGASLRELALLAPYSHLYACEPDAQAAQALQRTLASTWQAVTLIPAAMAGQAGSKVLNQTDQPGLTSLLQPNSAVVEKYYRKEFEVVSSLAVETMPLAQAAQKYDFQDACFLKLDTQGSELEILQSGDALVRGPILAVEVETEFQPFYAGQPLFADVDRYLRGAGYELFDLQRTLVRRASRQPAFYSKRQVVWADALYFKDPQGWARGEAGPVLTNARRAVALALAFGHLDFALELAREGRLAQALAADYGPGLVSDLETFARQRTSYMRLVSLLRWPRPALAAFAYHDRAQFG